MSTVLLLILIVLGALIWTAFSAGRGVFRGVRRAATRKVTRELVTGRDGSGRRVTLAERARRWKMRRWHFRREDTVEPRHGMRALSATAVLFVLVTLIRFGWWPWEIPVVVGRALGTAAKWGFGAYLAAPFTLQVLAVVFVLLWVRFRRSYRMARLDGEANTLEGRVRAAENRVIRQALELVWEDLGIHHEPRIGRVGRAKSKISGQTEEYGWSVALNLTGDFTFDKLMNKSDHVAQAMNALLRTMSGGDIDLVRRVRGDVPSFVDVIPSHRERRNGRQVKGEVVLTLMATDPFASVVKAPWLKAKPELRSRTWGESFRVGVWRDGKQASVAPVQTMVQGVTGSGKGTLGYSVAAEASLMEHVAIVVIDLKGGADLEPLLPRLSALVTTPEDAFKAWNAAADELDRRRAAGAVAEKPSVEWPAVLFLMTESQFYALGLPTRDKEARWAPVSEITTQGRAKMMIAFLDTQYGTTDGIPSSVSGPVDQLLSGRVTKQHQGAVTAGAAASKNHGPHKIKRSQKGVFFGEFGGENDRADFIRAYYYGEPEAARKWANRWARHTAELRVELPWLTAALSGEASTEMLGDGTPAPMRRGAWWERVAEDIAALDEFAEQNDLPTCPKAAKTKARTWLAKTCHEAINTDGPNRAEWEDRKARVLAALTA